MYVSLTLGSFVFIIWLMLEATIITTVMNAYLVIVLEDKDKISSHDWSIIMTLWCSAMASLSSSSSSNHYLPNSSWAIPKCIHDRSNVLSEIFSPLFLIRGGGGDEKSLEKWESGTGVRTKLKILAWVPLVIVFFLHLKKLKKKHNIFYISF